MYTKNKLLIVIFFYESYKNNQELVDDNQTIINSVEYNLNHILKNFNDFSHFSTHNEVLILI